MLNSILLLAEEGGMPPWVIWVVLGGVLLIMMVLPMFTRKKQANQVNEMLTAIKVGDKIKTVGGIIGTVVQIDNAASPLINEREFVIETGEEFKCQLRIDSMAIFTVINKIPTPEEPSSTNMSEVDSEVEENPTASRLTEDGDYNYNPDVEE